MVGICHGGNMPVGHDDELSLVVVMMVVITTSELFNSQIALTKLHLGLSCFRMVFLIQGK